MPVLRHPTTGEVINVPDEEVGHAVVQGYQPVSLQEAAQTTAAPTPEDQSGVVGGINSLATGALSGLTLGASDVALAGLLDPGQLERLHQAREQHGNLSTIGQIGGAIAPALLGAAPGSLLARSPAGIASRIGTGLADLGEGAGVAARIGAHIASGAAEGALQNAGAYVSDVALGDRDLSADAFVGAMGQGALWGGAGAGALALSGEALAKARGLLGGAEKDLPARKLFAAQDVTGKAAEDTRAAASKEIGEALDDGETLEQRAQQAIADQRKLALATDPEFAQRAAELAQAPQFDSELEGLLGGLKAPEVSPEGASLGRFDPELETLLHGIDVPEVGEVGGRIEKRPGISTDVIGRPAELDAARPASDLNDQLDARARQLDSTRVGKVRPSIDEAAAPEPLGLRPGRQPMTGTVSGSDVSIYDMQVDELKEIRDEVAGKLKEATPVSREHDDLRYRLKALDERIKEVSNDSDLAPRDETKFPRSRPRVDPSNPDFQPEKLPGTNQDATNTRIQALPRVEAGRDKLAEAFSSKRWQKAIEGGKGYTNKLQKEIRAGYDQIADAYGMKNAYGKEGYAGYAKRISSGSKIKIELESDPNRNLGEKSEAVHLQKDSGHTGLIVINPDTAKLLGEHADMNAKELAVVGAAAAKNDPWAVKLLRSSHVMTHEVLHGYGPHLAFAARPLEELTTELAARRITTDMHGMSRMSRNWALSSYHEIIDPIIHAVDAVTWVSLDTAYYAMQQAAVDFKSRTGSLTTHDAYDLFANDLGKRLGLDGVKLSRLRDTVRQEIEKGWKVVGDPFFSNPGKMPFGIRGAGDDLQAQLEGTKAKLDQGEELGAIGGMRPRPRGNAVDAELAKSNPTVAKLRGAVGELRDARADLQRFMGASPREYAAALRREGSGWRESVPAGEGNALGARGRQIEWRGSELERNNAEFRINNKVKPEERIAAGHAVDEMMERRGMTHEERIAHALEQRPGNVAEDINEAAHVISRYEAAHAGLAELSQELGIQVPTGAVARAEGFRAAQSHAQQATQQATALGADQLSQAAGHAALGGETPVARAAADKTVRDPTIGDRVREFAGDQKTVRDPGLRDEIGIKHAAATDPGAAPGAKTGAGGHLANAGAVYEALRMMGVPLPDPHDIPVIGPLLSVYLKARVIGKTFGRFGGRIAETAETTIARKAAETKQRVFAAVDGILHGASKAAIAAAPAAGGPAAILAHRLFDGSHPGQVGKVDRDTKDVSELYQRRSAELADAAQPGAVRQAIQARIRAADPTIVNAIADGFERQVQFLLDKMPKPLEHPGILPGSSAFTPNRSEMTKWARYVQAATDPASVLEQVAAGSVVSPEAAEALKTVYPSLFQAAQRRLLEQAADVSHPIPYGRRVQASLLFDVPLDSTMTPAYAAWAQQGYTTPAPPPSAAGATLHAPVTIAQMTQGARP